MIQKFQTQFYHSIAIFYLLLNGLWAKFVKNLEGFEIKTDGPRQWR